MGCLANEKDGGSDGVDVVEMIHSLTPLPDGYECLLSLRGLLSPITTTI